MANIKVHDLMNLNLTGADLFSDSESFMKELSGEDEQIFGGAIPVICVTGTCRKSTIICPVSDQTIVYAV
ncbi:MULTISPECIES: hypothetical protein [unclassified Tolypothrix]|uniref:hypothetical protein n=1 Tax=unclassified Tolypothrix TaxID=2649714 RepID=UPI0005EAAD39|nr:MULTISPECIES: hypothetical protein [unclassified Tolypothrix]BAY89417.1 hypothetical protein NIES3275_14200 [Microchaete diplosiphon NIES-3275]EKF01859.1 hypothetical protein FDUTEX481_07465 [Tolypothrix sp. PCC 7601]MBE9086150.1 hypothetical protein [Tolypothrix sp. LEGE 11397]UYD23706.1 hypothetical protein HGR01_19525 [Tolypothrix sp. PCC 7712]UYD34070.1 hypothetical protein HG267_35240 [Tolypothrix sp. PCC 7601]